LVSELTEARERRQKSEDSGQRSEDRDIRVSGFISAVRLATPAAALIFLGGFASLGLRWRRSLPKTIESVIGVASRTALMKPSLFSGF
jgi:hypothetical protein